MPDVSYSRVNWTDSPSTTTPINAENLNKMDKGISDCATEINSLRQNDVKKFSDSSYQTVDSIAYNPTTSELGLKVNGADTVIPFSKKNTETYPSANTNITVNGTYDMGVDNKYRFIRVNVPWTAPTSLTRIANVSNQAYTTTEKCFVVVTITGAARSNGTAIPSVSFSAPSGLSNVTNITGYSSGCCARTLTYMGIVNSGVNIPMGSSSGAAGYNMTMQNISAYRLP